MENTSTPSAAGPTRLDLMTRGGVASPAYLDVNATLVRASLMLDLDSVPVRALCALAARLGAHAEQLYRDNVRDVTTRLPAGLTVSLPTWSSDYARLTYRLLLTYRQQGEERIAMARGGRS
jgi:hypothetical protein